MVLSVQNETGALVRVVIVLFGTKRGQFCDATVLQKMRAPKVCALTANPPPTIATTAIAARMILAFFIIIGAF